MADWLAGDLSDDSLCGRDWLAGPRPPSTLITSHEYFNPITLHTQKFFSSSSCAKGLLNFVVFMVYDIRLENGSYFVSRSQSRIRCWRES